MLYPAEDRENKKLIYVCRRCEVTREKNPSNLINKTVLQKTEEFVLLLFTFLVTNSKL
jgi:hypothetical protein